jgi:hypothetical protein
MSSALHPDGKLKPHDSVSNPSTQEDIHSLIEARMLTRRSFIKGSVAVTAAAVSGSLLSGMPLDAFAHKGKGHHHGHHHDDDEAETGSPVIGFTSVAPNLLPMTDAVTVPAGYTARVLVSWGDSLTKAPHWDPATPMDEATQNHCYGGHTDGMHYFPFPFTGKGALASRRGLLVTNSEYVDPPLVNSILPASDYATTNITLDMVRAQQAGHGVNVVEIEQEKKQSWEVNRHSKLNRRITGNTPTVVSGPAAGHTMMQTATDPKGRVVLGTLNNCANGYTPWGTYLACEENFNGYFGSSDASFVTNAHENRYGISRAGFGYRWHVADPRFDVAVNRNEPNRFGWVVEVDPWDPKSKPVKRTALGRFKHESAALSVDSDNRVALYMGDDERNEYVYKFVCAQKYNKRNQRANRDMLDHGTLYVAKFNADGSGIWMPLVWGQNGLTPENGFANQGDVVIKARQAADRLGATMMDRPEWAAVHPTSGEVYLTLTNNSRRGNTPVSNNKVDGTTTAATANPAVDAANPRPDNDYGHIIRWREDGDTVTATSFVWDIFVQCGDKNTTKTLGASYTQAEFDGQTLGYKGNINGDDYGAPDGLWFDEDGRLWIQTDQAGDAKGDWVNIGGNVMMCADPQTGETRRFLTAPPNAEVTGVINTPDGKSMFVGIQHPGEDWSASFTDNSTWPDNGANGPTTNSRRGVAKPRSSVIVITKDDGGVIGT